MQACLVWIILPVWELPETEPHLTTEDPERSAMGLGTNSYNNVQLSRYISAVANRGSVFELSLLL